MQSFPYREAFFMGSTLRLYKYLKHHPANGVTGYIYHIYNIRVTY